MALMDYVYVQFGYSDVYGEPYDIREVINEIKQYNVWALAITCSKMSIIISKEDGLKSEEQKRLLRSLFNKDTLLKIENLLNLRKKESLTDTWVFFTEPPLLTLLSVALDECPLEGGKDMTNIDLDKFGRWMLVFAEEWTKTFDVPNGLKNQLVKQDGKLSSRISPYALESMRKGFAEQNFLTNRINVLPAIARTSIILKLSKGNTENFDIEALFVEALGIGTQSYISFCFSLMPKWSVIQGDIDIEKETIRSLEYFKNIKIPQDSIEKILKNLAFRPQEYKKFNLEIIKKVLKGRKYKNNFMVFMRKPLMISDINNFICISPKLLIERSTQGVYWQMNEYLNEKNDKKRLESLSRVWSYGLEAYINERLISGFSKQYIPNFSVNQNEELADGLILGKKALFVVETKYNQWPYSAKLDASRKNIKLSLQNILGMPKKKKGLGQIYSLITKLFDGSIRIDNYKIPNTIIPIIISGESVPTDPLNRRYYNSFAPSMGSFLKDKRVKRFIILTIEEVEFIETLAVKDTLKCEEILIQYSEQLSLINSRGVSTEASSFKNFLDSNKISMKYTKSLRKEFDSIILAMRKDYFGK